MATAGLSLIGFIDQQLAATHHLRVACVPRDGSDAALVAEWQNARTKLGAPTPNAGVPDIQPIPAAHDAYIKQLVQQSWVQAAFKIYKFQAPEFKLIEIASLLVHQFIVDTERAQQRYGQLKKPSLADLLPICLPQIQPKLADVSPVIDPQAQCMMIKSRNLNMMPLVMTALGVNPDGYESVIAGLQVHVMLPFLQVVKFNGRHYLHNGFHRAYGIAKAGVTHVPCLVREVTSAGEVGIQPEAPAWATFPLRLLESGDPPTVGHFVRGNAHKINIRSVSRIIQVSWSHSILPDEYDHLNP